MLTIVDYGMGNLKSIMNMLRKIGVDSIISSDVSEIENAQKLILPGVGAFDSGMRNLRKLDLLGPIEAAAFQNRIPVLGICLGMQLMTKGSQEGELPGLGWFDAQTLAFNFSGEARKLPIPHMGWNTVEPALGNPLFKSLAENRFYFVHSYYVSCNSPDEIGGSSTYVHDFTSCIQRGNIFGVQFHPEKSHKFGLQLLKNFCGFQP